MCIGGQYGALCNTGWGNMDASVVCRQLGFSPYGEGHTCTPLDKCDWMNSFHNTGLMVLFCFVTLASKEYKAIFALKCRFICAL